MVNAVYSSTNFQLDVASETAFNSGTVGTDYGVMGIGTKFTSYELDNAWTEAYEIGQRTPQAYYSAGLSAPIAMDFYLCQDQVGWLAFVLGAAAGGTYTVGNTIKTGQVQLGTPQGNVFTVGGIVFTTCKFNVQTGSAVTVSLNGTGASFATTAGTIAAGTIPSQLLTWKDVSLTAGVTTSLVQSLNFTIDTGAKQYYALGSAQYQTYLPLQSKISVEVQAFHNDPAIDAIYSAVVGNSAYQGGTVTVTIGTHTATFIGCYFPKGTLDLEPVKEATNTISFLAQQMTFV